MTKISNEVFAKDVYDELIDVINLKTDMDYEFVNDGMAGDLNGNASRGRMKQGHEFFYSYIPENMWPNMGNRGSPHDYYCRYLAHAANGMGAFVPVTNEIRMDRVSLDVVGQY